MSKKNKRVIVISEENYEALKSLGKMQDSFDDIVTEILEIASPILMTQRMKAQ